MIQRGVHAIAGPLWRASRRHFLLVGWKMPPAWRKAPSLLCCVATANQEKIELSLVWLVARR